MSRRAPATIAAVPDAPRPPRPVVDVSALPTFAFGARALLWWGTLGFMVAEGMTLVFCAGSYLYLRRNFLTWPPAPTPLPSLLLPTVNVAVMLVSLVPAVWVMRASKRFDIGAVRIGLVIMLLLEIVALVLRWYDFTSLNTRWDANAYGTASWTTVGFHATLLVLDFAETVGMTMLVFSARMKDKYFPDVAENAMYWFFVVVTWVALYVLLYLFPRWG